MPTPMTHAVVGASLSVTLPRALRGYRAASILGFLAVMPDLDIVGFFCWRPGSGGTNAHGSHPHRTPVDKYLLRSVMVVSSARAFL